MYLWSLLFDSLCSLQNFILLKLLLEKLQDYYNNHFITFTLYKFQYVLMLKERNTFVHIIKCFFI